MTLAALAFLLIGLAPPPDPAAVLALVQEGRAATKAKRYDAAIDAFTRALELDRYDPRARGGRGYAHYLAGRLVDARRDFQAVVEDRHPEGTPAELSAIWFNLALVAEAEKAPDGGLDALVHAEQLRPGKAVRKRIDALVARAPLVDKPKLGDEERCQLGPDDPETADSVVSAVQLIFPDHLMPETGAARLLCGGKCSPKPYLLEPRPKGETAWVAAQMRADHVWVQTIELLMRPDPDSLECGPPDVTATLARAGPLHVVTLSLTDMWGGRINEDDGPNCQPMTPRVVRVFFDDNGVVRLRYQGELAVGVSSDGKSFVFGGYDGLARVVVDPGPGVH